MFTNICISCFIWIVYSSVNSITINKWWLIVILEGIHHKCKWSKVGKRTNWAHKIGLCLYANGAVSQTHQWKLKGVLCVLPLRTTDYRLQTIGYRTGTATSIFMINNSVMLMPRMVIWGMPKTQQRMTIWIQMGHLPLPCLPILSPFHPSPLFTFTSIFSVLYWIFLG